MVVADHHNSLIEYLEIVHLRVLVGLCCDQVDHLDHRKHREANYLKERVCDEEKYASKAQTTH